MSFESEAVSGKMKHYCVQKYNLTVETLQSTMQRDGDSSGLLWGMALLKTETVKSKIVIRKQAGVQFR